MAYEQITEPGMFVGKWTLDGASNGQAVRTSVFADKSYGMWGLWGGATCALEGSWDVTDPPDSNSWVALKESDNSTAASQTANGCGVILENPVWLRPKTTGGTGSIIFCVVTGKYIG